MSPATDTPPTLSAIARLTSSLPLAHEWEEASQVIALDYFQRTGQLEDNVLFAWNGAWLRHPVPFANGTRTVVHLVLPDLLAPIALKGTVAGSRPDERGGNPWMLIWFDAPGNEDALLLRQYLQGQET